MRAFGVGIWGGPPPGPAPGLCKRFVVVLTSGQSMVLESTTRAVSAFVVSVAVGALDVWIGETGGGAPQFRFKANDPPIQIWLPELDHKLFVSAPMDASGCVTIMGP